MVQLMQRLLAGVLASAAVTGGTMAYTASQPIDGASIFELDDLAAQLPRDTRFYRQTSWLNWDGTFSAIGEAAPEGFSGQSETVSFDAYDAQGNYLGGTMHLDHELQSEVRYSYIFDEQGRVLSQTMLHNGEPSGSAEVSYIPQADGTTLSEVVRMVKRCRARPVCWITKIELSIQNYRWAAASRPQTMTMMSRIV